MAGLMGTNVVHDVGYLEFGKTYSFDLLVMCDEMIGYVRRMMEGIPVDTENLAIDVIKRVGIGGHFLADAHTLKHFRDNSAQKIWSRPFSKTTGPNRSPPRPMPKSKTS